MEMRTSVGRRRISGLNPGFASYMLVYYLQGSDLRDLRYGSKAGHRVRVRVRVRGLRQVLPGL